MKKRFCFLMVIVLILNTCIISSSAEPDGNSKVSLSVIYEKLTCEPRNVFEENIEQYSDGISDYNILSTNELFDIVADNPNVTFCLYAFSSPSDGFKALNTWYNGFSELLNRNDVITTLERIVEDNRNDEQKSVKVLFASSLLNDYYERNNEKENLRDELTYSYYKTVYTPNNSAVSLDLASRSLNYAEEAAISAAMSSYLSDVTVLAPCSSYYNCHSYAWANSPDNTSYWMHTPAPYHNDGSYVLETNPSIGSKVVYCPGTNFYHSGTVTQTASSIANYQVKSKWGKMPLVSHPLSICPYYYGTSNVYFYDTPIRIGVKAFQRYINTHLPSQYLGNSLVVDGGFGSLSRTAAVKMLQYWLNTYYNAGLTIDGGFGPLTYNACVTVAQGDSGMGVYILQGLLYGNGYNPQGFDGYFGVYGGTGCLNAVKAFQAAHGLTVDGRAGKNTFQALCV